jgi:CO/xanthine dehydrogenase Mo-binding subunit/CO/xanthine dehydrogenase FAD-binding subunit
MTMKHIGRRHRAVDWQARTSGSLDFTPDVRLPGLLDAAVLRSPHALARVRRIDTAAAAAMPGVHAVITAADLPPGIRYLHEGAADRAPLADGMVRFVGQEVAAVAADTREQAEAALAMIAVDYEVLAAPLSIAQSTATGAQRLHERPSGVANLSHRFERDWGDVAAGLAASSVVVGRRFHFPRQAHACLETNGSVAQWIEAEATLNYWTSTQAPYYVVREVAHALGLEEAQVVCREIGVGGGFGSKSKICEHEVISGALSRKTGRPVRLVLSREEEFETTRTRHAFGIDMQLHASADGRLQAITASFDVDNGAYNHSGVSVTSASIKAVGMMYRPQGVRVVARLIDTATVPGGSFRGYGSTQSSFAMESLMDELALKLGIDAIELRRLNANRAGETTLVGAYLGSARLEECLTAASDAIGWTSERASRRPGRGVGVAAGVHVSGSYVGPGSNRSDATIDVHAEGRVRVRFGGADAGTGQRTMLAQVAAEELGVALHDVDVLTMDSALTPFDMGAWSSRGTHYGSHAVRQAAVATAERLKALAASQLGVPIDELWLDEGCVCSAQARLPIGPLAASSPQFASGMLTTETSYIETGVVLADRATGQGNVSPSYNFACHAALVDVDLKTGRVTLLDYVAAHDIGTALNPIAVEGQAIGGAVMGIGAALGEEMVFEQGKLANPSFLHYAMPRSGDVPRVRPLMIEGGDPLGPYGAKAIGECGINPPPSAIANAVFDAIGIRFTELPITPDRVLAALAARDGRRRSFGLWHRPSRWWIAGIRAAYPLGLFKLLHRRTARFASRMPAPVLRATALPRSLPEAIASLDARSTPLGGGTDLQVQRRQGLNRADRLMWTGGVASMKRVDERGDGTIEIGAAVTLAQLALSLREKVPVVAQAIDTIASRQVREMATLGGNLAQAKRCWFYRSGFGCYKRLGGTAPCYAIGGDHRFHHAVIDGHRCQATTPSDLATVLHALDATAIVASSSGERRVPMARFYSGPGETVLAEGELLRAVELPASAGRRVGQFVKLRLYEGDFAIASVAMVAEREADGALRSTRLVFGGLAPVPWEARRTADHLDRSPADVAAFRRRLDRELDASAHPLARNGWKLDAAAGLAEKAYAAIVSETVTA